MELAEMVANAITYACGVVVTVQLGITAFRLGLFGLRAV